MKTIMTAIAATLLATAAVQADERGADRPAAVTSQQRDLDARYGERMPVSLERTYDEPSRQPSDDAYRASVEWTGNDNEG
ncbi:hypothetical protein [Methylopila turkensis]|uniref:Uncharacterized protein n=1 Tax=Methylopila turkensis TaxID=1437816 RepID=A0A9W6JLJ6_9HYPH|nr:hypothetical protein [Methylopila turkensis]GLK78374.1 hypothetical protein GCM10008174_01150 [Methylopila turkensis]